MINLVTPEKKYVIVCDPVPKRLKLEFSDCASDSDTDTDSLAGTSGKVTKRCVHILL